MKSNWETTKEKSNYHFNPGKKDNPMDVMTYLGHLTPSWQEDLADIIANSKPATWATRGYKGEGIEAPPADLEAEEYDLTSNGMSKDFQVSHLNWKIPGSLQKVADDFGLGSCMQRIHVQKPGELWNLHIDKLHYKFPAEPDRVMRIFIQLTDWEFGQFWEFGTHHWNQWRAGDVVTFDWENMPHCTANAGYTPRVTFQLTGVRTEKTDQFLAQLGR